MRKILITGGAGFIGSALARRFCADGHEVGVMDDFSRGHYERLPDGAWVYDGDVRDYGSMRQAIVSYDTIFHLAYVQGTQTFYSEPRTVVDVALNGIMSLLRACEAWQLATSKSKELFLVSSSEVYQVPPPEYFPTDETVPLTVPDVTNPRYSYGAGKIASEVAVLAYAQAGVLSRTVIVRPHNVYGPDMGHEHVIPQLADKVQNLAPPYELKIQGSGRETRSFCHIDDCVEGFAVLLEKAEDRTVYHLGNPYEETAIGDLAAMILQYFGLPRNITPSELPKGSPTRRLPDISRLRALGFEPRIDLVRGLRDTLAWYDRREGQAA